MSLANRYLDVDTTARSKVHQTWSTDHRGFTMAPSSLRVVLSRTPCIVLLALLAISAACGSKPTAPVNRRPIITGAAVIPPVVFVGDSALIIVSASDPDGDPLVYDWYADGRFRLKDAPLGITRYSSPSDSQLVYYVHAVAPLDTGRIAVFTRDTSGLDAGVLVQFVIKDTVTTLRPSQTIPQAQVRIRRLPPHARS